MTVKPNQSVSELRGIGRLAVEGVIGTTDLVEAVHYAVGSLGGLLSRSKQQRTGGITGFVYSSVRTTTRLTAWGIDAVLEQIDQHVAPPSPLAQHPNLVAHLNGLLGDHLANERNPLAIPMQLQRDGKMLPVDAPELAGLIQQAGGKVILMVHGSCMSVEQWRRQGHDHGAAVADDLGLLPLYLMYNSGRHVSENGAELSLLLEALLEEQPDIQELSILAFSMGGLVARSACHVAKVDGCRWLGRLRRLIFLGTPHHGAPLEQIGNWLNQLLDVTPYSEPFGRVGRMRSAGITDLRYGNITDQDWRNRSRFQGGDRRLIVPLPAGVECFTAAATSSRRANGIRDRLIGDGLVPLNSALGYHHLSARRLLFPADRLWVGRDLHHFDLLNDAAVYGRVREWMN